MDKPHIFYTMHYNSMDVLLLGGGGGGGTYYLCNFKAIRYNVTYSKSHLLQRDTNKAYVFVVFITCEMLINRPFYVSSLGKFR